MSRSRLTVPEMSCDVCRATIEGALTALPGVAGVLVDLETKHVTVEHNQTPVSQLTAAIEDQGYDVTSYEAL